MYLKMLNKKCSISAVLPKTHQKHVGAEVVVVEVSLDFRLVRLANDERPVQAFSPQQT